ncbi:MAG: hypothetical protein ACOCUA_03090 [archaeon]
MSLIDAARKRSETDDGEVALIRSTYVTSALAAAHEDFPLQYGEWAVVTVDGDSVVSCSVHDSLLSAEAEFETAVN